MTPSQYVLIFFACSGPEIPNPTAQKGIMRNSEYLERFFRNLILGETNELRNRYMVVNAPEGLVAELVRPVNRTSSLGWHYITKSSQSHNLDGCFCRGIFARGLSLFGFITDIKRLPKPFLFEFAHAS